MDKMERDYRKTKAGKRRFENKELYKQSLDFQTALAKEGIAWHNVFADECTVDFCCCEGDGKYHTHLPSFYGSAKQLFKELFDDIKHGDQEHQDWLENKLNDFLKNEVLWDEP